MAKAKKTKINIEAGNENIQLTKGVSDSVFSVNHQGKSVTYEATRNFAKSLSPIQAYELSAALKTAISARNSIYSQVKIRLFNRVTGEEIVDGDLYEFCKHPNSIMHGCEFLETIGSWNDLASERVVLIEEINGKVQATPLNPFALEIQTPLNAKKLEQVTSWRYHWENGDVQIIPSDKLVFTKNYNPASNLRGSSKAMSLINQITASYQTVRYVKSFFSNNACPSIVVKLPAGMTEEGISAFKDEFNSMHSAYNGKAWTAMFVSGDDIDIKTLDSPLKDTAYNGITEAERNAVFSVYQVPPLHSGMWDKTRFDSVEQQNNYFYESYAIPSVEDMQNWFQHNIVDRFFRYETAKTRKTFMSKSLRKAFDSAAYEASSDIVAVFDVDHIPAIAQLKQKKIDYAIKLMDAFKVTPAVACEEIGLELDLNESANWVWYKSDQKYVDLNQVNKPAQEVTPPAPVEQPEEDVEQTPEQKERTGRIHDYFRSLRKMTLEKTSSRMWTLNEADALAKEQNVYSPAMAKEIRQCFLLAKKAFESENKEQEVKALFNSYKQRDYRRLAK